MKFVVDAQLPPALCGWLHERGHDAVHVRTLSERPLPDDEIARWAIDQGRIVISKDADFPVLCRDTGLVWLRCGNLVTATMLAWLAPLWPDAEARLLAGETFIELT